MSVEAPKPSVPPLQRLLLPISTVWNRFWRGSEHQVDGLLSPERIQTEGRAIIIEAGATFQDVPEYSHARASVYSRLRTKRLSGDDVSGDTVVIDAGFTVGNQRVTITVTEDSERVPLSLGMKVQDLNAESHDPASHTIVETRRSEFYRPEISLTDSRPGRISPNPDTLDAVVGIRANLADLRARLQPVVQPPV